MKPILFVVFTAFSALIACSSVKKANSTIVQQGITGQVTELSGNRMPKADAVLPAAKGISTTVFVYEPTNASQATRTENAALYTSIRTRQVASVQTDSTGSFTLALEPGSYSIFIKRGKLFYANLFDTQNNIAVFTVEAGKLTKVNLTVSLSATF